MTFSPHNLHSIKRCLICGQKRFRTWATTSYQYYLGLRPDIARGDDPIAHNQKLASFRFPLKQCLNCSFVFTSPQFSPQALAKIYTANASYFEHYQDDSTQAAQARRQSFLVEIRRLKQLTSPGSILDLGCSGGFFLKALGPSWQRIGVDIDPHAIKFAKKLLGQKARLFNQQFEKINFPKNSFDVVILRGTIEHLPNPKTILKRIFPILKPGGLLALNTPNIDSFCARLYRRNFRMIDPIHHIWYFSPSTIKRILNQIGFQVKAIDFNYFNTPYFHALDLVYLAQDWLLYQLTSQRPHRVSPPFYGNLMDVYAIKPL